MNMKLYNLYLILLLISLQGLFLRINAQETTEDSSRSIQLIARPLKDSILLRWAPASFGAWMNGNKYGYRVFRTTITKDSIVVNSPQPVELTSVPLKPWPIEQWKDLVLKDKYAPVAAQVIFGNYNKVNTGGSLNPDQVYSQAQEQLQRFSIALYAAGLSPEVAKASGLLFVDKTVLPNERYLYMVVQSISKDSSLQSDTGFVYTGFKSYQPLPSPAEFNVKFGDKEALLSWNAFIHNHIYMGYFVEKSSDGGKTYTQINTNPITFMVPEGSPGTNMVYKFDSLQQNGKEYFYRVQGISSFGEKGPYSSSIGGTGKGSLSAVPENVRYELIKEKVKIVWDFPKNAEKEIAYFKVLRSDNDKSGYKPINDKINRNSRVIVDNLPLNTGYYKVVAWRDSSRMRESFPLLVQLVDSIPPLKPEGLSGFADTSGIVRLTWTANKEEDIFGYRVFRSVSNKDEYSQLTSWPLNEPNFSDTLSKNNLNAKVYYKIMAVDQRQNESEFSKILELRKPDIIPPSSPVFKKIDVKKESITTEWIGSSSNDVKSYSILRKIKGDTSWIKLKEITSVKKNQEVKYIDKTAEPGSIVIYKLEAIDENANHSKPAVSIEVNSIKSPVGASITGLQKNIDDQNGTVRISWKKPDNDVQHFWIYRKTADGGYTLYETIPGSDNSFTDKGLKAGNKYYYRVKAIYKDKSISAFSDEVNCVF